MVIINTHKTYLYEVPVWNLDLQEYVQAQFIFKYKFYDINCVLPIEIECELHLQKSKGYAGTKIFFLKSRNCGRGYYFNIVNKFMLHETFLLCKPQFKKFQNIEEHIKTASETFIKFLIKEEINHLSQIKPILIGGLISSEEIMYQINLKDISNFNFNDLTSYFYSIEHFKSDLWNAINKFHSNYHIDRAMKAYYILNSNHGFDMQFSDINTYKYLQVMLNNNINSVLSSIKDLTDALNTFNAICKTIP